MSLAFFTVLFPLCISLILCVNAKQNVDRTSETWTTTWSKQYLSSVHHLTCSLLWVGCLFDPLQVWGFGANDPWNPWMESFRKFMPEICVSTAIHVSWPNLAKIGRCEVAEKSYRIADKKTPASGTLLSPPISAPLNRSRPKFRERCRPLTCACVLTLVRIGSGLPDLFRKESKKVNTINIAFSLQTLQYISSSD